MEVIDDDGWLYIGDFCSLNLVVFGKYGERLVLVSIGDIYLLVIVLDYWVFDFGRVWLLL